MYPGWELWHIARFDEVYDGERFVPVREYLTGQILRSRGHFPRYVKVHGSLNHYYYEWLWEQTRASRRWIERRTNRVVPLKYAFDIGRIYQSRPLREYAPSTQFTSTDWTYDQQRAELKLNLTPPIYTKPLEIRSDLEERLEKAERIVFVGYSMADIDLGIIRLFRRAYQRHPAKQRLSVEVVNRDATVLEKIAAMYYESAVRKAADTLEEFASKLGEVLL